MIAEEKKQENPSPLQPSDGEVLRSVAGGDSEALEILYSRYSRRVFNLALKMMRDREQAEDITQDVFVQIHMAAGRFRYNSEVSTWIYRITINRCLNILRKNRFMQKNKGDLMESGGGKTEWASLGAESQAETGLDFREMEQALHTAVQNLPSRQKAVFILSRNEHLSNREIASILGTSVPVIEARLHRAREKIRKLLVSFK